MFLFDLDMTLFDSSAIAQQRRFQMWDNVRQNMHLIRPFPAQGRAAPHELPALLRADGQRIGIVTSSPEWYATSVLQQFRIPYDVLVSYGNTQNHKPDPEPILEALRRVGVAATTETLYIGDDVGDIEASYHAGVTSVAVRWGPTSIFELSSSAPDVFMSKASTLLRREHSWPRLYWRSVSAAVLSLKSDDTHAKILGEAVGRAIATLDWAPDYVVPVPMKPSQQRNRFELLLNEAADHFDEDIELELKGLRVVKEIEGYKQMNSLERAEAIKGAFHSNFRWNNNKILLIDDVYTTGETTGECVRTLAASGAGEVRIMTLAKDQRVFARKTCPACGRSMKIRENHTTHFKFWGCSGYPHHCQNTENF
ncbi:MULTISPECIES: HAD-IA family hydrolase [Bradyrhizobium]|uniref:HAD family hydrolase n=3 Tax=Bradyrhizobium TaxID=374 RepID=A0AAE5X8U7_9BRAD|nr:MULTISPECIES: HAD-IA family hydrolase [Bradyrhizobium]MCG2632614.1 HAD-IA family hydrolase [Bradyrhizobium zhengyangense]MCG2645375.1 HAD-IA family hydrolase [Bradyrhizobium zhengyangense]MCG2672847.1 HAD-IA family hydrolase [Bradyrhizobium zhengyangense]MDN4985701.1 HAD-IA family hydrolase [Bradyrhizobium sp. WYCCWR 13022]MDT4740901.1 HAD-IA family hydrolase [Bradyrhizobium sp. WYCCWR 12699]